LLCLSLLTALLIVRTSEGRTPPAFTLIQSAAETDGAAYEGAHDKATCEWISGWAWDSSRPNAVVQVEIYDGNERIATVAADRYRADLARAGKGNGYHAFEYATPARLKDGRLHTLRVRVAETGFDLFNTMKRLSCSPTDHRVVSSQPVNPMLFTGPLFLFFFLPLVLIFYFLSPKRIRNTVLLCASLIFYAWGEGGYVLVLLASLLLNYTGGWLLERQPAPARRRLWLWLAIGGDLLILGVFKYARFLLENLNAILLLFDLRGLPLPSMHLPIGISFYTFMGISYVVDVYRRQLKGERNLRLFALYLSLFPHLIAGPIVRYSDIGRELVERFTRREDFAYGIRRFIIGLGKKMIVANQVAQTVDLIFSLPTDQLTFGLAWLGIASYTLQIYFDFAGYSDMAIGLARMFGFHFPENFDYPYAAQSITAFWQRWHISLSTWLRDYLFFPLGVRHPKWRLYLNVMIVFLLCGLWHGANWTFVIWGLFHGAFLVIERAGLAQKMAAQARLVRHLYTLLVVMLGWVFFRAETLAQAVSFIGALAGLGRGTGIAYHVAMVVNPELLAALVIGLVGSTPAIPLLYQHVERVAANLKGAVGHLAEAGLRTVSFAAMLVILLVSVALSAAGTYNPFIYFRF
jgi:alginate O-acetyltransferase complex protein AlgI